MKIYMQVLKGDVVILNVLHVWKIRVRGGDAAVADLCGVVAEDPVLAAELVIDAGKILVVIQDVRHIEDRVDVQDVGW